MINLENGVSVKIRCLLFSFFHEYSWNNPYQLDKVDIDELQKAKYYQRKMKKYKLKSNNHLL